MALLLKLSEVSVTNSVFTFEGSSGNSFAIIMGGVTSVNASIANISIDAIVNGGAEYGAGAIFGIVSMYNTIIDVSNVEIAL